MVEREGQLHEEENIETSGLSPFKSNLYSTLWTTALFLYIGASMYDVGASWLMTSLAPNPLLVSLITTATTLPIFLLHYHLGHYLIFLTDVVFYLLLVHTCLQYLLY
jgi:Transmembrane secretion effector